MTNKKLNINLLDEDSALLAIETVGAIANQNNIEWALVGDVTLNLYGSDRYGLWRNITDGRI